MTVQECGPGKLMLYAGIGADGKPLNDAWILDLEKLAWSLVYSGHSDLCPPQVLAGLMLLLQYLCRALQHLLYDQDAPLQRCKRSCLPLQGAVATLHGSKLVCLNSAAGSPKLDLAMSLDLQATAVRHHS